MKIFEITLTFECINGHLWSVLKYFRTNDHESAFTRLDSEVRCPQCNAPRATNSNYGYVASELTEEQFKKTGMPLEPYLM